MDDLSSKVNCSNDDFRLDYADAIHDIILGPLKGDNLNIKGAFNDGAFKTMSNLKLSRDDLMDKLREVLINPFELPTKTKTAFTREYNKAYLKNTGKTIKKLSATKNLEEDLEEDLELDDEDELDKLEEELSTILLSP